MSAKQSSKPGNWVVLKFGGTSVATAGNWDIIVRLVKQRIAEGLRPVVVHSAVAGISNRLEAILALAKEGQHATLQKEIVERHLQLGAELGLDAGEFLEPYFRELDQLVAGIRLVKEASPRVHARMMALGELMATTLGAAYLRKCGIAVHWQDAREVLTSMDMAGASERACYLSASCEYDPDPAMQARFTGVSGVVLTQGFIAHNSQGETVLLGRGGSDTSAAYFAARLQAVRLEIWTDVPGMFSADPHAVSGSRLLRALRYDEAQEIASTGGSVLHPRCVSPVSRYGIPLWVKCTSDPDAAGTVITRESGDNSPRVKAISKRSRITLVSMETLGMWHEVGFLAESFKVFSELGLSVDLVSTSQSNVTVTLDPGANSMDAAMIEKLRLRLEKLCRVQIIQNVAVVSLVGTKIRAMLDEIGPALEVFEENPIHLLSQAANDLNLSFVVDQDQVERLVKRLHALLVKASPGDTVFGETWEELREERGARPAAAEPWWQRKRARLVELAHTHSSAYVYDRETLQQSVANLRGLQSVDRVFYSIKANSNPDVLRVVHEGGINFECVSPGEIRRVLELFPTIHRGNILFTPNFAPRDEYEYALEQGVHVTLDNLHPLREWAELFRGRKIILRLDTGYGRGHHSHVRTAGVHSKFGIPLFELDEAIALVEACDATVVGLHAHTGSGILTPDNWAEVARTLAVEAQRFPAVKFLDLGGGLGVPEKPGQSALDMAALDISLAAFRKEFPQFELWLEPGRYVVATAGVLVACVTQTKGKGKIRYIGLSTGMNSLIRPALYGAYHEIANITRTGEPLVQIATIVGPNCESGDRLGTDRLLPDTYEGDVLAIANAGAYGYVMSSHYNLRDPAREVMI